MSFRASALMQAASPKRSHASEGLTQATVVGGPCEDFAAYAHRRGSFSGRGAGSFAGGGRRCG